MNRNPLKVLGAGIIALIFIGGFFLLFLHINLWSVSMQEYIKPEVYVAPVSQTPPIIIKEAPVSTSTILFVGDVMLGRNVELLMNIHGDGYPFAHTPSIFAGADEVIANLEGPITIPHTRTPGGAFGFTFDKRVAPLIKSEGIGIVTLGNNHTHDYGAAGYSTTVQVLDTAGVQYAGNPFSLDQQYVLHTTIKELPITLISFNFTNPSFDQAGALALVESEAQSRSDFLIVAVHGGTEYELHSTRAQQDFYRKIIDAGADVLIGHHPHVVEEIESYKGKLIFYSLGNFIFDQYFSTDVEQGLAVKMAIGPSTIEYSLSPIAGNHSEPRLMASTTGAAFLQKLANKSSAQLRQGIIQRVLTTTRSRR
jgi:poly-gamma-glutamate synthesis protein (capsule biosynthesis protein)